MKPIKPNGRAIRPVILAIAISVSSLPGQSQDKPTTRQRPEPALDESKSQAYDLEVKEGVVTTGGPHARTPTATLANVIDAARERYPDVNIVIAPGLANISVSDLKLRTSSISEELEAIRVASGGKFEWSGGPGNNAIDPTTGMPTISGSNNKGLFTLREPTAPENQRIVEAFNIALYLHSARPDEEDPTPDKPGQPGYKKESKEFRDRRANERLEQLKRIILETISALHPNTAEQPTFQFHHGANLLVLIGSREAIDVARKVVSALGGQAGILQPEITGSSEPGMPASEREAWMQRYGLNPNSANDAFRKRYGLGPQPGAAPPQKPQP